MLAMLLHLTVQLLSGAPNNKTSLGGILVGPLVKVSDTFVTCDGLTYVTCDRCTPVACDRHAHMTCDMWVVLLCMTRDV